MTRNLRSIGTFAVVSLAVIAFANAALAQDSGSDANTSAEAEMKAMFGTIPMMMEVYPEHMRAGAWEWFKSTMSPDAPIPPKYAQLMSLSVSAQIPCAYCIYAHTTMARMFGASEAEIEHAVAIAGDVRHWSSVMNGNSIPLDEFKKEWDGILAHLKEQMASE